MMSTNAIKHNKTWKMLIASTKKTNNTSIKQQKCKLWDNIVLVENTFVSMWLRHLNCTATFGSHLSDVHIDKIQHSRIKHVTFLWDAGTGVASEKAVLKLRAVGIACKVIELTGQPDDHELAEIEEML